MITIVLKESQKRIRVRIGVKERIRVGIRVRVQVTSPSDYGKSTSHPF